MRTVNVSVSMGGKNVAEVAVEQFDSMQEVLDSLGEEEGLKLVNAQHKANITNAARAEKRKEQDGVLKKILASPEMRKILAEKGLV